MLIIERFNQYVRRMSTLYFQASPALVPLCSNGRHRPEPTSITPCTNKGLHNHPISSGAKLGHFFDNSNTDIDFIIETWLKLTNDMRAIILQMVKMQCGKSGEECP